MVLQQDDGSHGSRGIRSITACELEIVKSATTHVTQRSNHSLGWDGRSKRAPAPRAQWLFQGSDGVKALGANRHTARVIKNAPANAARSGEEDRRERAAKPS